MGTPIILFAFRRPNHTQRTLESLARNSEAKDAPLTIFIDGPRNEEDLRLCDEVEAVARSRPWCGQVNIVRRPLNWGVLKSVVTEVTDTINRHGSVIVLEDDLDLSPFFLRFMEDGLARYHDEPRVMEISGYRYPVRHVVARSVFVGHAIGWGWATWKRAWNLYETDPHKLIERIESAGLRRRFDLEDAARFMQMLRDCARGRLGAWDVRWSAAMLLNQGLTFCPAVSLVNNIGHDGTGTNCNAGSGYNVPLSQSPVTDFPEVIVEDAEFRQALRRFFIDMEGPLPVRLTRNLLRMLDRAMPREVSKALRRHYNLRDINGRGIARRQRLIAPN
jgi:hypothetical protein